MGSHNSRRAVLYTTVSLSVIILHGVAVQSAIAQQTINYTGTDAEYNALGPLGEIRPVGKSGNTVTVSDQGNLGDDFKAPNVVYGGYGWSYSSDVVTITGNRVEVSSGTVGSDVTGGVTGGYGTGSGALSISDNSVLVSGGTIRGNVSGGDGSGAVTATGNSVEVSSGTISGNVSGGIGYGSGAQSISDNSVLVSGGTISMHVYGGYGWSTGSGFGAATITGNSVLVSGGTMSMHVYGGYGIGSGALSISDNSVLVSRGTVRRSVYGGYGSGSSAVTATGNRVEISGGAISGSVYGGYSSGSDAVTATGNSVEISGGAISGSVYGGYGRAQEDRELKVINNTVTLTGDTSIVGSIYGGYAEDINSNKYTEFNKVIDGNTLNLNGYRGSVAGIYNFENYNWVLPKSVTPNQTIITINGDTAVDLSNTKHTVALEAGSQRLNVGDQITLISKATGSPIDVPVQVNAEMEQGHFIIYDIDMEIDDVDGTDAFVLKIKGDNDVSPPDDGSDEEGGRINPRTKALLEGRAAALGFLSQGSDLIAITGIDNIRMMACKKDNVQNNVPFLPFLITKGSSNRYDTGSHIDVRGFHMATGIASGTELEQGHKMTIGAFFEYGRSTYDTYNSFNNYASVKGNGDTHYTGGGIFGRFDFAGTGLGYMADLPPTQVDGFYLEASLRAGRASMSFNSNDLIDPEGYRGNYDSKSNYWGGHAAAGYVFNFDKQQSLDVYGRYLWTRMKGDSVVIGKDKLHFDSAASNRTQVGGRYNYAYSDQFKPYIGAAYEYEFSGSVGASAYNFRLDEPSLKGSTGIIEAGFSFTPNARIPDFSIDVTGQGFFGQRHGGSGEIKLKYQF